MVTGSLQIKKNNYYVVLNLVDAEGNKKKKWVSTGISALGHTKRAAQKALADIIEEYENKPSVMRVPDRIMFIDHVNSWVENAEYAYDPITYQGYKNCVDAHIRPYFSKFNYRLSEIDSDICQEFMLHLNKEGNLKTGKGLSPRSVRIYMSVLSSIFEDAKNKKKIADNPVSGVKKPSKKKKDKFKPTFYTAEQLITLFNATANEPIAPMIRITAAYGLRRSELLGLKWDSIDFTKKTVEIKHTVTRFSTVIEKDDTKSESSHRTYKMPPEVEAIFIEAKKREERNRALFGENYIENEYVFKWDNGKPYAPDYITRKFKQILAKYDLPEIRLHDLRHSCASVMIEQGYNLKVVQSWLGHSDIQTTGNVYSHVSEGYMDTVAFNFCASLLGSN